jgi:hypothetical protein
MRRARVCDRSASDRAHAGDGAKEQSLPRARARSDGRARNGLAGCGHDRRMQRRSLLPLSGALVAALVLAQPATAAPAPDLVSFQDLHFEAYDPGTVLTGGKLDSKLAHKPFVIVAGASTAVKITTDDPSVSKASFGIGHQAAQPYAFEIAFGGAGIVGSDGGLSKVAQHVVVLQDNCAASGLPTGKLVGLGSKKVGAVSGLAAGAPGSTVIAPHFVGAETYRIRVTRKGIVLADLSGQAGAFTLPASAEYTDDACVPGTLGVLAQYGKVADDAWSIVLLHRGHKITITPEAAQAFTPIAEMSVRSEGLDQLVIEKIGMK